jgi:hypothetical protein
MTYAITKIKKYNWDIRSYDYPYIIAEDFKTLRDAKMYAKKELGVDLT